MDATLALLLTLGMATAPALLFLGLFKGLERMQQAPVVQRASERADIDDPTVSFSDAINGLRNDGLVPNATTTQPHTCTCDADNPSYATYCQSCRRKL